VIHATSVHPEGFEIFFFFFFLGAISETATREQPYSTSVPDSKSKGYERRLKFGSLQTHQLLHVSMKPPHSEGSHNKLTHMNTLLQAFNIQT
jgi:hypothetical protein